MTTRPLKVTGLTHGQNQEVNEMAQGLGNQPAPSSIGQSEISQPVQRPPVFAPTERPGEPPTTGTSQNILPNDPASLIRALYVRYPNEDLRRLLERAAEGIAERGEQLSLGI